MLILVIVLILIVAAATEVAVVIEIQISYICMSGHVGMAYEGFVLPANKGFITTFATSVQLEWQLPISSD